MTRTNLTGMRRCACGNLRRTTRAITQFYDQLLQPCGLRSTQVSLLLNISLHENISVGELGARLLMDQTTVTRNLGILRKLGFINIKKGDDDARKKSISLTESGAKKLMEARIEPPCRHFASCGGCEHQNISYQDQLGLKEQIFQETLDRAKIKSNISPIIAGSDSQLYYRNTIRFFIIKNVDGYSLAMHNAYDFHKFVPVEECLLQSKTGNEILKAIIRVLNQKTTLKSPQHLLQLRLREGKQTGEFMVEFITKDNDLEYKNELTLELKSNFPMIRSCYQTVCDDNLFNAKRKLLFGSPIIYEKIGKYKFQISPESFFQTNSLGVKTIYDKIKEFADIQMGDRVLDLFCGTGTIGIYLSTLAKKVTGIEIVQNAVNDAKANAKLNNIANCEFICANAEKWLSSCHTNHPDVILSDHRESNDPITPYSGKLESSQQASNNIYSSSEVEKSDSSSQPTRVDSNDKFNVIIVDPPRQGLSQRIIEGISKLSTKNTKLVYISCNPATFARDIKEFEKYGLKLKKVQPVDMFPQTHHIECVGLIG
jgi:23S rRNA (uracil1939-C5)-methyltransferase